MTSEKLLAILRLQTTKNVGDIMAKRLISATGNVEQIFKEKPQNLAKINGIGSTVIQHLFDTENFKRAEEELNYIQKSKVKFSYFLDNDYPENLKHCIDAPILLFYDGNINLNTNKILSIVGTRNITSYGRDFCNQLIEDLTPYNSIIVSGFAYGVDICAHKAAIKQNLQTIAVFAHGLDSVYPKTHKKHIHEVKNNGGIITEFWHNETPQRENFLKRNRIVAGISRGTIIIESAKKGGSLVTADIANSYNRDVFALAGRTTDIYSEGCNNLIKNNQAHLLSSAEDVVKMFNWDLSKASTPKQKELFVTLTETEQKLYDYLLQNGKQHLDLIALECQIPVYQLSSILVQMELKDVVKPLPGKLFEV
ncbi:DNA processing protein DprA [Tenacibaculum holothuriorum]|uniref:DNA processing protein DprA n=1 Tax=Tenacibaculum holothuriorum TaxID=1635173 RepID=A0A1Y2PEY3_9FLAO|nr:DNA-processing protein DprA [Tenacibaculum holothuriorum]OSY89043.1 DNA processing protein DprA [Tenacibaculum holothuriorum]